jgi:hypothetical protein
VNPIEQALKIEAKFKKFIPKKNSFLFSIFLEINQEIIFEKFHKPKKIYFLFQKPKVQFKPISSLKK